MFIKGMFLSIQVRIGVHIQKRYPLWTVPVQPVRQFHKAPYLILIGGIHFFDRQHGNSSADVLENLRHVEKIEA
jgi:hypothetical protein